MFQITNMEGETEEMKIAKRYANLALIYAVIAMIFGVFYREFTKFQHFTGQTNLSVIHTHRSVRTGARTDRIKNRQTYHRIG